MTDWDVAFRQERGTRGEPVLAVSGEIDLAVAARFADELTNFIDESDREALVDLADVGFMDSSGVRQLLIANQAATQRGSRLVLVSPSDACRHVLEVSGAWAEFKVRDR